MKVNWSIARLTLLCLVLFPSVLKAREPVTNSSGQDSAAKAKSAKQKPKPQKAAPAKKPQAAGTAAKTQQDTMARPGGRDSNTSNNNSESAGNDPDEKTKVAEKQRLADAKKQQTDRIDAALQQAKDAVGNDASEELQQAIKLLAEDGRTLKGRIESVARREELSDLDVQVQQFEKKAADIISAVPSKPFTFSDIASSIALLLSLLSLAGLAYMFLTFRRQLDQIVILQAQSREAERDLRASLKENKEYAETVEANLSRVKDDLGLQIHSAKRNSEEAKRLARARESAPNVSEPVRAGQVLEVVPDPTFPSLVADYLNRLRPDQRTAVEADFRTDRLVAATAESAPFVFVEDADGSGAGIVLPKPHLQRSQEFSSYYKGYYHCTDPSAGEVYIIEPAVVSPDGKGWRLSQMGRMEIH